MAAPCGNCGSDSCHFCGLARRDHRYAELYGLTSVPFRGQDCIYRGEELGLVDCPACAGSVQIKTFGCGQHGKCSIDKDVGLQVCTACPERRPFPLHQAQDWRDLGKAVPINQRKFNPSLIRYRGRLLLATRIHTKEGWSQGQILLSVLSDDFGHTDQSVFLRIDSPLAAAGLEDPRLWIHQGRLHVSFTGLQETGRGAVTHVLYARLGDDLQVEQLFTPHYPGRQAWEKNWGFFSEGEELYAVYQIAGHKILRLDGDRAQLAYESPTSGWPAGMGEPRGGAAPVKRGNEWYSFFHDVREGADRRHYGMYFYTFEDRPPFRINRIGRVPLFLPDKKHRPNDHTPDVIFPGGAFLENNLWHVAAGYYDNWSWLLRFDVNELEKLADIAPGGRDSALVLREHENDWIMWSDVYNRNEYGLPDSLAGQTVVDVGGHVGSFARACLDRGAAQVISLEPHPENATIFRQNLAGYEARYVLLEGAAFGKCPSSASLIGHGCGCRVTTPGEGIPIASFELGRLECDLLKLDCEGSEYEILEQADLGGVSRIVGEGHLFAGLPGMDWMARKLAEQGFRATVQRTGPETFIFSGDRS